MNHLSGTQTSLLALLSKALFEKEVNISVSDWKSLFREANLHKVFPIVFDVSKEYVSDKELLEKAAKFSRHNIATTVTLNYAHAELHRLMEQNGVKYVTFKGLSSSLYYPKPELRNSGDVDFFVKKEDFEKCESVLQKAGFTCEEHEGKHATYQKDGITLELHRTLNGMPNNELGERIRHEVLENIIETAVCFESGQGKVMIPDKFHHGMILLLHTLSHMTGEGFGLRHLCDWAVFDASLTDEEIKALFEEKLKEYGLLRFARILSLCGEKYLGSSKKQWHGEADDGMLEELICDIMASGNFGKKDADRKGQIKYIADRGEGTVKGGSALRQGLKTIRKKARLEHKSEPAVVLDYVKNVLSGKRKPDTTKTLENAAERKALYSEFHLFETDN